MSLFIRTQSINNNQSDSAYLELTLEPETAIIGKKNMVPGDKVNGVINVANTGTVDTYYFISVKWYAYTGTSTIQASRLANALEIEIEVPDPYIIYAGKLSELIDQPPGGRLLTLDIANEDLEIIISLPKNSGTHLAGIALFFDLIFVAT
ncbi:hypothetical protein [Natronospora cellulosivora (SeqCode)]